MPESTNPRMSVAGIRGLSRQNSVETKEPAPTQPPTTAQGQNMQSLDEAVEQR